MKLNFKTITLIILFTCPIISFSQEINKYSSWIVKHNATALIDIFTFPTVQFAVEKKISDSFSIQTEVGYQLYHLKSEPDTTYVKVGGFKINVEGRFYFCKYFQKDKTKKRKSDGLYNAIELFYRENKYNTAISYTKDENAINDEDYFDDNFGVIKKVSGVNLRFGYQKQVYHVTWEPYLHFGVMYRKIKNINREFNEDLGHIENYGEYNFFGNNSKEESSGIAGNFGFGLRVGYRF